MPVTSLERQTVEPANRRMDSDGWFFGTAFWKNPAMGQRCRRKIVVLFFLFYSAVLSQSCCFNGSIIQNEELCSWLQWSGAWANTTDCSFVSCYQTNTEDTEATQCSEFTILLDCWRTNASLYSEADSCYGPSCSDCSELWSDSSTPTSCCYLDSSGSPSCVGATTM